jgi:hypothetical protein
MLGHVRAFLSIIERALPNLFGALNKAQLWTGREVHIGESTYRDIEPTDFSAQVLAPNVAQLFALRFGPMVWSDLGTPTGCWQPSLARPASLNGSINGDSRRCCVLRRLKPAPQRELAENYKVFRGLAGITIMRTSAIAVAVRAPSGVSQLPHRSGGHHRLSEARCSEPRGSRWRLPAAAAR